MLERGRLWLVLSVAVVAMCVAIVAVAGSDEAGVRMVIRATARTSLALFLMAFVASSLRKFIDAPFTAWMLRNRRYLGLSFAISHALHLAAIGVVAIRWPHPFMEQSATAVTLLGGGAGYVGLTLMALTSFDGAVKALGAKRWRALHLAGSWILWLIFLQSYAGMATMAPWAIPVTLLIIAVAAVRIAAWSRRRHVA